MRRREYGPVEWSLASPAPGTAAKFRRWNLLLIAILAFLVIGVFVAAEAPGTSSNASNAANAALKENASPASVRHANSTKGAQPEIHDIHSRGGSGYLNKELKSGHHAG
jgi:hypothetical protein